MVAPQQRVANIASMQIGRFNTVPSGSTIGSGNMVPNQETVINQQIQSSTASPAQSQSTPIGGKPGSQQSIQGQVGVATPRKAILISFIILSEFFTDNQYVFVINI